MTNVTPAVINVLEIVPFSFLTSVDIKLAIDITKTIVIIIKSLIVIINL